MVLSIRTDRLSRWMQGLSLLLAAVIGLQGVPLQSIVHSVQHAASHHTAAHHGCTHPTGVCPMNPGGPCQCDHDDTHAPSPDGPVIEGCDTPSPATLQTSVRGLRVTDARIPLPRPRVHIASLTPRRPRLSSQRTGDDVFHPPRLTADVRPASTLQVAGSA